jgi:hypothetical protein
LTSHKLARVRNVFLVLIVLNVAFFGWARWIDRPHEAAVAAAPGRAVPALELTQLPATAPATAAPLTHCRSIGPFPDTAAAAATADALRSRGLQPHERSVNTTVPDGYWVYVEDLKDAAARRKVISTLNAAGMRDAAAMPDEAERVSVGVFSDQRHAVHRAEQVQELGFRPVLSVHQRSVSTAWLDVELKANESDPTPVTPANASASSASNAKSLTTETVRIVDCPVKAAGG